LKARLALAAVLALRIEAERGVMADLILAHENALVDLMLAVLALEQRPLTRVVVLAHAFVVVHAINTKSTVHAREIPALEPTLVQGASSPPRSAVVVVVRRPIVDAHARMFRIIHGHLAHVRLADLVKLGAAAVLLKLLPDASAVVALIQDIVLEYFDVQLAG